MIIAKTTDGFTVELEEDVLDYRLVDDLAKMEKDGSRLIDAVDRLLGEQNKERLLEHLADKNGRVPLMAVATAIGGSLLASFAAGKNSASSPN